MGRKRLPKELKAKNFTIKVYDWEREEVRDHIQKMRAENMEETDEWSTPEEVLERYREIMEYEPSDSEIRGYLADGELKEIEDTIRELRAERGE